MEKKKAAPISCDALKVIKLMSMDRTKAKAIALDATVLGGVVIILSNEDEDLVKSALEILYSLSRWRPLHEYLRNFIGLVSQLESVTQRPNVDNAALARSTLHHLTSAEKKPDVMNASGDSTWKVTPKRTSIYQGAAISKSKMLQFVIHGLVDRDDMDVCRNSLLSVKGVISITFDYYRKRVILRISPDLKPELLAQSIANTMTMTAEQVLRDEHGVETFISFKQSAVNNSPVKPAEMPDYPEDDDDEDGKSDTAKPIAKRLGDENGPWMGQNIMRSMSSFISNSFYW